MSVFIGQRFQVFDQPGSMGIVHDVTYWRCFWPKLGQPTALFAKGSSGLKVVGSSRNIIWPDDTEFLDYYPDAFYPAEQAVFSAFPGQRLSMINLTQEMVEVYMAAYEEAVASFPPTHAVHSTRSDCHFLRHKELVSAVGMKPNYEEYIAELTLEQVESLKKGDTDVETLKVDAEFVPISMSRDKADTVFRVEGDSLVEVPKGGK